MKKQYLLSLMVSMTLLSSMGVLCTAVDDQEEHTHIDEDILYNPTDDTFVGHSNPDKNYGQRTTINIRNEYGGMPGWADDGLIKFDLSQFQGNTPISNAVLSLYYIEYADTNPAGRELNLYRVTSQWEEDEVTWNTQPTYAAEPTTSAIVPEETGTWMTWNVTTDVQDFLDGVEQNYGWKITDEEYWGSGNIPSTHFASKENGEFIPELIIEYQQQEPTIIISSLIGGYGLGIEVENRGDTQATNITWEANIDGGILFSPRQKTAIIDQLSPGEKTTVTFPVFGIGLGVFTPMPEITATVYYNDQNDTQQTAAIIFFPTAVLI